MKQSVYQRVTDQIVACLETGTPPWKKDWLEGSSIMPIRHVANEPYTGGLNILLLWIAREVNGYEHNRWLTYKMAQDLGFNVGKGEKGTLVTYVSTGTDKDDETKSYQFYKPSYVFNVEQVPGLVDTFEPEPVFEHCQEDIALADRLPQALNVHVKEGMPSYSPTLDVIKMPTPPAFRTAQGYMSTLAHETVHATGHKSRCDRDLTGRFGDEAYAMEELIAEIGAAFITAQWGMHYQIEQHASYIESWLKVLKRDPKAIFTASAKATQATKYIENALRFAGAEPSGSLNDFIAA